MTQGPFDADIFDSEYIFDDGDFWSVLDNVVTQQWTNKDNPSVNSWVEVTENTSPVWSNVTTSSNSWVIIPGNSGSIWDEVEG